MKRVRARSVRRAAAAVNAGVVAVAVAVVVVVIATVVKRWLQFQAAVWPTAAFLLAVRAPRQKSRPPGSRLELV